MRAIARLSLVLLQCVCSAVVPTLLVGCEAASVEEAEGTGTLKLALTASSASGAHYRLEGVFDVHGPEDVVLASADEVMLSSELSVGDYEITLRSGWQLLRETETGEFEAVSAELRGSDSQAFTIASDSVTRVAFGFTVAGQDVELSPGTLEVGIDVEERPGECASDSDCAQGSCVLGTCGTAVSGVISDDTTWTKAASPYVLTDTVQIGGVLTVEAGARIVGRAQYLEVHGRMSVEGTSSEPVKLQDVWVQPRGAATESFKIEIAHARFEGGTPYAASGDAGSFDIHDSTFIATEYWYVWYPTSASSASRNVFLDAGGISIGSYGVNVSVNDNYFVRQTTSFAIESWASYSDALIEAHGNTFASTDRVALSLPPLYSGTLDGTGNYWGTSDASTIAGMILDRHDDLNCPGYVDFEPVLAEPNPNTPTP